MLYPDFHELIAFKERRSKLRQTARRSVASIVPGNHHSPFRGQGLEFDSVREYVPGDDIRNIDWRVTARTGSPHLKLFKEERERRMLICVDMNASMRFGTRNTFKSVQAARVSAFLGWQGLAHHDCVGACLFGDVPEGIQFFKPSKTRQSFCNLLKMLAEPAAETRAITLSEVLQHISKSAQTGSLIYFISDFMDLQEETELCKLNRRCDLVFVAINDPADRSIASVGTIGCSAQGEKLFVNTDSRAGREAYARLWEENRERLYALTAKFKIPLIELTTESDIQRDLVLGLKTVAKGGR
ncbi:MAG: DUF58 domain-containing protein [Parachlamydia sp.]|nr:DUF58 domain-containing protein [Parachlamydia sp.]